MSRIPQANGCPSLEQQVVNRNTEAELRINLEMGKLGLEAIKKFKAMFKNFDKLKEVTQLKLIEKVFTANKDFMKDHRALLLADSPKEEEEEDDYNISIDLTSSETASKTLN